MTLTVAEAAGSHLDMGRAQGQAFAHSIDRAIDFYAGLARNKGSDLRALAEKAQPYLDAATRSHPELVEELRGMAEGAGVALADVAVLNCLEEVWSFEACTTMTSGPYLLHAEQWYSGHSDIGVVISRPHDGPAFVSPTCVGFLPAVGMSAAGFAQGIGSLSAPDDRVGIPRVVVSRLSLGAATLDDAIGAAQAGGRAGGYAHTLASARRKVVVETSATTATVIEGTDAHTNHYLGGRSGIPRPEPSAGSTARLARARQLLNESPPASLEDCARLLSDHSSEPQAICLHERGPEASSTVFGMACDLAGGRMIVSHGSPCGGRWEEFHVPGFVTMEASRVG